MAIIPHEGIKGIQELLEKLGNSQAGSSNHEMLQGLLGGDANGHYHLKFSEVTKLKNYPDYEELNHERLKGLLGGSSEGHYHLTVDLLNKLINLPSGGGSGDAGVTVIDNLTSTRTDAALSANQGRVLNSKISSYHTESWTFTLEDGSTVNKTVVLSS